MYSTECERYILLIWWWNVFCRMERRDTFKPSPGSKWSSARNISRTWCKEKWKISIKTQKVPGNAQELKGWLNSNDFEEATKMLTLSILLSWPALATRAIAFVTSCLSLGLRTTTWYRSFFIPLFSAHFVTNEVFRATIATKNSWKHYVNNSSHVMFMLRWRSFYSWAESVDEDFIDDSTFQVDLFDLVRTNRFTLEWDDNYSI